MKVADRIRNLWKVLGDGKPQDKQSRRIEDLCSILKELAQQW
jgi:hypothetical protein